MLNPKSLLIPARIPSSKAVKTIVDPLETLRQKNVPKYIPSPSTFQDLQLPMFNLKNNMFADMLKQPDRKERVFKQKTPKHFLLQLKAQTSSEGFEFKPMWPQNSFSQSSYIINSKAICENISLNQARQALPLSIINSPVKTIEKKSLETLKPAIANFETQIRSEIFQQLSINKDCCKSDVILINQPDGRRVQIDDQCTTLNFGHIDLTESEKALLPKRLSSLRDMKLIRMINVLLNYHYAI